MMENMRVQEIERVRQEHENEKRNIREDLVNERVEAERNQASGKIKELKGRIVELESENTHMSVELERQRELAKSKTKEVEAWREKYNKLENSKFVEIDEVKNQVELLKRSSLQINDYEVRFKAERTAYEAQILQYKQKFEEMEIKIEEMTIENERINSMYIEKRREVEESKARPPSVDLRTSVVEADQYRREIEILKRDKFDHNAAKVRFEVERRNYENEIDQLHQTLNAKKIEIAKLYDLIDTRKAENENILQELAEAREEIARNVQYYKELEDEFMILNSKYDQVTKEVGDINRSKDMYRSQIEQGQREIAKKNRELINRIHEVDSLKVKYEEAYAAAEPLGTLGGTRGTASSKVFTRMSMVETSQK